MITARYLKAIPHGFRFIVVGAAAAALHAAVVTALVSAGVAVPLVANIFGFLCAFGLSYTGQRCWTFSAAHVPHRKAAFKYFAVAGFGFALNETVYAACLGSGVDYRIGVIVAIISAAASTYLLSRFWAFKGAQ